MREYCRHTAPLSLAPQHFYSPEQPGLVCGRGDAEGHPWQIPGSLPILTILQGKIARDGAGVRVGPAGAPVGQADQGAEFERRAAGPPAE